ncbi:MAG: hypothetical protein ACI8Q1_001656 [Parvicella sp.]|jgi:hypothetical protein
MMKKQNHIFISFLLILLISLTLKVSAQSNVTAALSMTTADNLTTNSGPNQWGFGTVRNKLGAANADCFLITASYISSDFQASGKEIVYSFALNNNDILQIGVEDRDHWYIRRKASISNGSNIPWLDYEIYDDLGVTGNFTFIIGHYFTAIAVDVGGSNYKMAPVFFGMDSNIGTLSSHLGEFTGETSLNYSRNVYIHRTSKTWRMSNVSAPDSKGNQTPNHSITKLIQMLNDNRNKITNARLAEELVVEQELEELSDVDLNLYPNPSNGQFELEFVMEEAGEVSYQIFDLGGKLITQSKLPFGEGVQQWTIKEQSKLRPGLYSLKIKGPSWASSKRLIIE